MRKILYCILISLLLLGGLSISRGLAQAQCVTQVLLQDQQPEAPEMCVSVTLLDSNRVPTNTFSMDQPIMAVISLQNVGGTDIVTLKGFGATDFSQLLQIYDPDSKTLITSNRLTGADEPPPPPRTNTEVEILCGDPACVPAGDENNPWARTVLPFSIKEDYTITAASTYQVKIVIPMEVYAAAVQDPNTLIYYASGLPVWSGDLESNTQPLQLITDTNFSSLGAPEILVMQYTGNDCTASDNDQSPSVFSCTDYDGGPANISPVYVVVSNGKKPDKSNYKEWFRGEVPLYGKFEIDAKVTGDWRLTSDVYIMIYDQANGNLIQKQKVKLHASSSEPLNYADQYGSLKLVDYVVAK